MSKELLGIKLGENNTIKSVDLVSIINEFRKVEDKKELQHKSFMAKIRKEVETLKSLGLDGVQNILPSSYINSQNKEQPCFELNRDGMLQMLNSESTLVRYKTIEFINKLEEENKQLKEDLVEVSKVAISDKEQKQREYETKKVMYSWRNLKTVLFDCDYYGIVMFFQIVKNEIVSFTVIPLVNPFGLRLVIQQQQQILFLIVILSSLGSMVILRIIVDLF